MSGYTVPAATSETVQAPLIPLETEHASEMPSTGQMAGPTATTSPSVTSGLAQTSATSPAAQQPKPAAAAAPAPAVPARPAHHDPKVNELQTMFPTVDTPVIEMILESCGGSQDRAIEQLLSMTDENFKPDELAAARREEASQLDLDAEFARSLQMQDNDDLRRSRTYSGAPPEAAQGGDGQLPYQPRVRRARPPQGQQQYSQQQQQYGQHPQGYAAGGYDGGEHDLSPDEQRHMQERYGYDPRQQKGNEQPGMMMMEEKLEKFAEVGKQTFNSLLSKAKAKYSEYQAQQATTRTQQEQQGYGGSQGYGGQGYGQGSRAGQGSSWAGGASSGAPGGGRGGMQNWNQPSAQQQQRGGLWEDSRSFDSRDESIGSESGYDRDAPAQPQPVLRQSASRWQPTDTYDDPPAAPARTNSGNRIELNHGGRRSPAVGSPDRPTAGKIDPAKLGLLPKKRVDLLSTSPSASNTALNRGANNTSPPTNGGVGGGMAAYGSAGSDPNPTLPSGETSRSLMSKIPAAPPAGGQRQFGTADSDDELEYTR